MPVFHNIAITLDIKEVLSRQGMGGCSSPRSEIAELSYELLASVDKLQLLEPDIAYESYSITRIGCNRLYLENSVSFDGSLLPVKFSSAKRLAVIVCTIGPKLEKAVADYFRQGEPLRGLLLDGIGNAAIDSAARQAYQLVRDEALPYSYQVSSPANPGIPGFSVSEQWTLFTLAPAGRIGVTLSSAGVMSPCKSISMVMGMGPDMPVWNQDKTCMNCNIVESCGYRTCRESRDIRLSPKATRCGERRTPCPYHSVIPAKVNS